MRRVMILVALLLIGLFVCSSSTAEITPPPAKSKDVAPLSTRYLCDAVCRLYDNGDGTVTLYGKSVANQTVDQIWVKVTLQRWTGAGWVDVNSGYRADRYNTFIAQISKDQSVQRGCYYRCKGQHQVIHNGCYDPNPPLIHYTDPLWIQ
ncbi:MAG: DUF6147 family protein [Bacillota bacterium]